MDRGGIGAGESVTAKDLMQWFIEFVITDMYVINPPTALMALMRSPTVQCHLSTLGAADAGLERGYLAWHAESLGSGISHQTLP